MAGPKAKIPQPIDRPLSRAYLREFGGWSTEYPPGLSDPTSLRLMENIWIARDGAARIRPGLRYLSYSVPPDNELFTFGEPITNEIIGSFETFFLNDGSLAYLFAVREDDDTVGFRVLVRNDAAEIVKDLDAPGIDFTFSPSEAALHFTSATTYVTYLQIDNKIFALSNAGETMRMFTVGENKTARKLSALERPAWNTADKLTVLHPDAPWINDALPDTVRVNRLRNPSFEGALNRWSANSVTDAEIVASPTQSGAYAVKLTSKSSSTNLLPNPLADPDVYGISGWNSGFNYDSFGITSNMLRVDVASGANPRYSHFASPRMAVEAGQQYRVSWIGFAGTNTEYEVARIRFFDSGGTQIGGDYDRAVAPPTLDDRYIANIVTAPAGAVEMDFRPRVKITKTGATWYSFSECMAYDISDDTSGWSLYYDGDSGADFYWTGTAGLSPSVWHPPKDVRIMHDGAAVSTEDTDFIASGYFYPDVARNASIGLYWEEADGTDISNSFDADAMLTADTWTRLDFTAAVPALAAWVKVHYRVKAVPRNEPHYIDACLLENHSSLFAYFDGDTADTSTEDNEWIPNGGWLAPDLLSQQTIVLTAGSIPTAETRTTATLMDSVATDNTYNFGFFYTLSNEVGETAASQVTVVKTQRGWSAWRWETPNASGEPSGVETIDPTACADQLVAILPEGVFDDALLGNATKWTLYLVTWSNQDPVPAAATQVAVKELASDSLYETDGWLRITPQQNGSLGLTVPLPTGVNRENYSDPSRAANGVVASDRMVLVLDPARAAQIKWSSNEQGEYHNFTATRGGGYKTLTTGNLMVPAAVKLWQNPQSVDTLTILCLGTDGRSTGYYMAPAQISQQSETVTVMGFEETTATPGTTSPYACEVFNNALYHPLDDQLMKSTAMNYNINHKSQTEQIRSKWAGLLDKVKMSSTQLDGRLYYLVNNPEGAELEPGCTGNEIWILDGGKDGGTWSRWLVQGHTLRTLETGGYVYVALVRGDGIYYFDPTAVSDYYADGAAISSRNIPWYLETNTQGANRAHDAWSHLRQVNITLGNFFGSMRYGIRFQDINGKHYDINKGVIDLQPENVENPGLVVEPWDIDDWLQINRSAKEWFFYAGSEPDGVGQPRVSFGQLNLVQYRYAPISVNVGYEYGSVETFEYARSMSIIGDAVVDRTTEGGVPMPFPDRTRP